MPTTGRKRIPNDAKREMGYRSDRVNEDEPVPVGPLGEPPAILDADGVEAWLRIAPELEGMKLAKSADRELVTLYCDAYSTWVKAREELKGGLIIETSTTKKAHPAIAIKNQAELTMARILAECGMTPSSRAGLKIDREPEADEFDEFRADC